MNNTSITNEIEFSVTEISNKIKWLLENNFSNIRIKGEISGLKIATSGHGYFSLKDRNSVLAAICWRNILSKVNFKLSEGLEVIVSGKITAYAGQSKYQISVESIQPAGIGTFIQILNERKKRLGDEGLFNPEHKRKIPHLPQKIGIITSITGAVVKDIIHRITDRFPMHLCIWPVAVQGENASPEITNAIDGFNALDEKLKPDLLIVARGGGSIEDLWPFNEEIVLRAAFKSKIPIISAVGHETDHTLLDLVADLRAPTPTAAAEFAVPVLENLRYTLNYLFSSIDTKTSMLINHKTKILKHSNQALRYLINYINNNIQKIDELGFRLYGSLPNLLKQKDAALRHFSLNRLRPNKILEYKNLSLNNSSYNLSLKQGNLFNHLEHKLSINKSILSSLDYNKIIARGYAMIKNQNKDYISTIEEIKESKSLAIKVKDGETLVVKKT